MIVARCQSDADVNVAEAADEGGELGIVGEDVQEFGDENFSPSPGVSTVCVFPKNSAKRENLLNNRVFFFRTTEIAYLKLNPSCSGTGRRRG